jgi:LuxR family maltose regulon positive regulatory protein
MTERKKMKEKYSFSKDHPLLDRPRLYGLLEEALLYPILMVEAGAGWGKTQGVHSFLRRSDAIIIWVQLSPRDNLGGRFWEHYTGAMHQAGGDTGTRLAELGFPETIFHFDRFMTLTYEKNRPRKKYITVFDDFHFIQDPAILLFFSRFLAVPPPDTATILISRTEPALNTLSLLSRGILTRISAEELRFTPEEIDGYFQMLRIPLSGEEAAQIYRDTEGWPLAVDLIARELKNGNEAGKNYTPFLKDSFRKIEDSLFAAQGKVQQKFLIKLSLLDYWPQELLEELPEEKGSMDKINSLSSFIRYDTYLRGYRIHNLFLDFLREKQEVLTSGEIRAVYIRAAEWCLKNKLRLDAAAHYEKAGDPQGLRRVIDSFPRIPPQRVTAFLLDITNRLLSSREVPPGQKEEDDLFFLYYIVRAKLFMCLGNYEESTAISQEAIRRFEPLPSSPRRSRILQAAYNNLGTLILFTCRFTRNYDAARCFEQGFLHYQENPEPAREQTSHSNLGSYVIQVGPPAEPGEIERSLDALTLAVPFAAASLNGYLRGVDSLARAELAYYQADLNTAEKFARQAVFQGREKKQYEVENRALFYLMRICVHRGNFSEIRDFQRQLKAQLEIPSYINRHTIHDIGMGRFYAHLGLTKHIAPWIRSEYEERDLNALFHNFEIMVNLLRLFSEKDYAAIRTILENKKTRRELESYLLGKLELTILESAARYHLGEEEKARILLEEAWKLAASCSLDMPFIEMGEDMRLLAEALLARKDVPGPEGGGIPRPWLENIRNRASAYHKMRSLAAEQYQAAEQWARKQGVYLTFRERTILSSLVDGLARKEIAVKTGLSLNTVKGVISAIYGKLGAVNRADAIRIALDMEKFPRV